MISPEKLTKKKLSQMLVRKHKKFLKQHQKEFEILEKIRVIKEKQDLLEYWLTLTKNSKKEDSYLKKLEKADQELEKLKDDLVFFSDNGFNDEDLENRHKYLKSKIQEEEKALPYWQEKSKKEKGDG